MQACNYVFWPHSWFAPFVKLSRYIIMYVEACRVASGSVRPKNDVKFCRKNENVPLFFCTRVQACNYVFWPHSWVAPFVNLSRYIIMYVEACRVASGSVRPKNDVKFCRIKWKCSSILLYAGASLQLRIFDRTVGLHHLWSFHGTLSCMWTACRVASGSVRLKNDVKFCR